MPIIRQGSLFGIQDLYDLEPTQRFDVCLSCEEFLKRVNSMIEERKEHWGS